MPWSPRTRPAPIVELPLEGKEWCPGKVGERECGVLMDGRDQCLLHGAGKQGEFHRFNAMAREILGRTNGSATS